MTERHHLEDSGVEEVVILKWICGNWNGDENWIDLAQDRDNLWSHVNAVMNLLVL